MTTEVKKAMNVRKINYKLMIEAPRMKHELRACRIKQDCGKQLTKDSKANSDTIFTCSRSKTKVNNIIDPLTDENGVLAQGCRPVVEIMKIHRL